MNNEVTVEDCEAIRQLIARYNQALDLGDSEAYADCFTSDGAFWEDGYEGSVRPTGREELRDYGQSRFDAFKGQTRHWNNGNFVIEGDGQSATISHYMMALRVGMLPMAQVLTTGMYYDKVVKIDGKWLFAERHFVQDPQFAHRGPGFDFDASQFAQEKTPDE